MELSLVTTTRQAWEQRTGGVEGPVLAALRPLSANAVRGKARALS